MQSTEYRQAGSTVHRCTPSPIALPTQQLLWHHLLVALEHTPEVSTCNHAYPTCPYELTRIVQVHVNILMKRSCG